MSSGSRLIVVDASIVMKWFLDDEDHVTESLEILASIGSGELMVIAPDHIRYEVANALWRAVRTGRLNVAQATTAVDELENLAIPTVNDHQLVRDGLGAAVRYGCAFYDGLYLALANRANAVIVHADRRLQRSLAGGFALEAWIEDFAV